MSNIKFSDGMEFDTTGNYHMTKRSDGWYVVGRGMLLPVDSPEEGRQVIKEMEELAKLRSLPDKNPDDC